MSRLMLLALAFGLATLPACDDESSDGAPMDAAVVDDMGNLNLGDSEVDAAPEDAGMVEPDMGEVDQGAPCNPMFGYGLDRNPIALADEARFSPRAVFNNGEWGVIWQTQGDNPVEPDVRTLWFGRVDAEGAAIGDAVEIGKSRFAQHDVVWTGSRYMVAFISARVGGQGFGGIQLQAVSADGTLDGEPGQLQPSFDASHLALGWANGAGGMVIYAKGRQRAGADGLFARPVDETGQPFGPEVQITDSAVLSPAVAYGDASWGIAWLDRDSNRPLDLMFAVINDRGELTGDPIRQTDAGGQGLVHIAYGMGAYGVGWSQADAMGQLGLRLSLFDLAGDALGTVNVGGPEGFGLVTDVSWLTPNFFGVAWQDAASDGTTVGLSRVTPAAQVSTPIRVAVGEGPQTALSISGTISRAGAFYTHDPTPPDVGFSAETRLMFSRFAPCN